MRFSKKLFFMLTFCTLTTHIFAIRQPRLTVVITLSQLSYEKMIELKRYLKGGLHYFLNYGIIYHNAYQPHATPSISTSHATLSTGTLACTHGIIGNSWYANNNKIKADNSDKENSAVFNLSNQSSLYYDYGKSAQNLCADTLSDSFMLSSKPYAKHTTYSLSLKSSPAILTAGRLGKAIWFDKKNGNFTSSRSYFKNHLPAWLTCFNKEKQIRNKDSLSWHQAYKKRTFPYRMFKDNVNWLGFFNKKVLINHTEKNPYKHFLQSPQANSLLFELAQVCIENHANKNLDDKMLIWLTPTALHDASKEFEPDSLQITDLIYHLDLELYKFYQNITKKIRKKDVLIVITSDNGTIFSPESLQKKGYGSAHRISTSDIKRKLNSIAHQHSDAFNLITHIHAKQVYFNTTKFSALSKNIQQKIISACKEYLIKIPGIKNIWEHKELYAHNCIKNNIEQLARNQLYSDRSGKLIIETEPYCLLTHSKQKIMPQTPYNYSTHIPLIIYQARNHEAYQVYNKVCATQLAPTLAHLLGINTPAASTAPLLPLIAPRNDTCF